jgi:hypothetical protein
MTLNKTRYLELLEKNDMLNNQKISLIYSNPLEHRELLEYQILVEGQIYFSNKTNYIKLIETHLNKIINETQTMQFFSQFREMFQEDNKKLLKIENQILKDGRKRLDELEIHQNSIHFSNLIFQIVDCGENLTLDPENAYGITLSQFREIIKKNYLEMKKL